MEVLPAYFLQKRIRARASPDPLLFFLWRTKNLYSFLMLFSRQEAVPQTIIQYLLSYSFIYSYYAGKQEVSKHNLEAICKKGCERYMSASPEPPKEHPSTYIVADRTNQNEIVRLQKQDRLVTAWMGGPLAEQSDITLFQRVLDIGCGTGGWLLELAEASPAATLLIGVDINHNMVQIARQEAQARQLHKRVEFHTMDALRMLEFPDNYFDLVNVRAAMGYLRTWDWPKFLQECRRVCRPGGVVRMTEGSLSYQSTSPTLLRLYDLLREAFYRAGHLFSLDGDSLVRELPVMFERFGFEDVQTREHRAALTPGSEEWRLRSEDIALIFRNVLPFLQKWIKVPEDYQELYQQLLLDLQKPDFDINGFMLTVWGRTPQKSL